MTGAKLMRPQDRFQAQGGFPFSTSLLRSPKRLHAAGLTERFPTTTPSDSIDDNNQNAITVEPGKGEARIRSRSFRMGGRLVGLRLLPLDSFVWGGRDTQPRTRPDHVLIWVATGRMQVDLPRHRRVLREGDLWLIPAGTAFSTLPQPGASGHVALIPPSLAARADPPLPKDGMRAFVGHHAALLLARLRHLAACDPARPAAEQAVGISLLSQRLAMLDPDRPRQQTIHTPTPDRMLVERFVARVMQGIGDCASVADVARELGSSMTALDNACIAARGRRAVELVAQVRLEQAVQLLRNTATMPARIAVALGYSSHAHFTRAFVAATGRTPEIFRAQLSGSSESSSAT